MPADAENKWSAEEWEAVRHWRLVVLLFATASSSDRSVKKFCELLLEKYPTPVDMLKDANAVATITAFQEVQYTPDKAKKIVEATEKMTRDWWIANRAG